MIRPLRIYCWFWLACFLATGRVQSQNVWPSAATVAQVMTQANNYWTNNGVQENSGWAASVYFTGNQLAAHLLGNRSYINNAFAWSGTNQWSTGPEGASWNADALCCGQVYQDLYSLSSQSAQLSRITNALNYWVISASSNQLSWIDAFFMAGPTFAEYGTLTGNTNYNLQLWRMFAYMRDGWKLYDPATSLWYRDVSFIYPGGASPYSTNMNGGKVFWSRGNGWVFAGLARVLQQIPTTDQHYQDYATMFQKMAAALAPLQGADGFWRSSLLASNQFPNPESSGTALFTYGYAWGVRNGLLPALYTNNILLAWQGLTNLALKPNGKLGYVQGAGYMPGPAYNDITADFGVGAFLLACGEIERLATNAPTLSPWAGLNQSLVCSNYPLILAVNLDASKTTAFSGSFSNFTWWEGTNLLATGVTNTVSLPLGQHAVTLNVIGADGLTYTDTVTIAIAPAISSSFMPATPYSPVLAMRFKFNDVGNSTTDTVSGVVLNCFNANGIPTDLHGTLGSGIGGSGRCLDFSSATMQGGSGPIACTTNSLAAYFGAITNFTLSFWINPASTLYSEAFPRLFTLGNAGLSDHENSGSLQILGNGNNQDSTSLGTFVNSQTSSVNSFGGVNLPVNQWSFVTLTYDSTSLNLYSGTTTTPVSLVSTTPLPAGSVIITNAFNLFIGNRLARDRAFQGRLDEIRFYVGTASSNYVESIRQSAMTPVFTTMVSGSSIAVQSSSVIGTNYILQTTTSLLPPIVWTSIATNTGTGGLLTNSITISPRVPQQFFRIITR